MSNKPRRIFLVAKGVPEDVGGAPIRNYHLLKALCKLPNTEVELFCLCSPDRIESATKQLESELPIKAHLLPYKKRTALITLRALLLDRMQPYMTDYRRNSDLASAVRTRCEEIKPDVIHIEQMDGYYPLVSHLLWMRRQGIKIALDAHNIEAEALKGATRTMPRAKKVVGMWLVPALRHLEDKAGRESDIVFACSEPDLNYFSGLRSTKPTHLIPNGVDCEHFTPSSEKDAATLLFIGGTDYPPNTDALTHYINDIHPRVKQRIPAVRLLIIGGGAKEWITSQGFGSDPSLVPLGFVPDIKPYLDQATIGICPVREGSGTRIKVLTYMAAGLPVVSTSKGAEGIGYTAGKEIFIADTAADFSDELVALLKSGRKRKATGNAGRSLTTEVYDWEIIGRELRKHYGTLLGDRD